MHAAIAMHADLVHVKVCSRKKLGRN